jgi:hypothetical protein
LIADPSVNNTNYRTKHTTIKEDQLILSPPIRLISLGFRVLWSSSLNPEGLMIGQLGVSG